MKFSGYEHGINFGGWYSQCDHSLKRYDYFVKRDDFRRVKRWGFDHVRIPVDYELVLNDDFSYREDGFRRLEECIAWCREDGLNMILDLHKTPGFSFDAGENEEGFFYSEKYQQIFYDLWSQFARRFGSCENLSFELLNEVSEKKYCGEWNRIIRKAIKTIRIHASQIHILVGGYHNNSIDAIRDLDPPYDENIVYNFHCYSPLVFTHQGAYWIPQMKRDFRMPFRSTYGEYEKATRENIYEGYIEHFKDEDQIIDRTYFIDMFKQAIEIAKKRNAPLYCGEYGVIDLASKEDTLEWYRCISSVFDEYGIGRAMWSYKEMDFGLCDAHYDDIRKELLKLV